MNTAQNETLFAVIGASSTEMIDPIITSKAFPSNNAMFYLRLHKDFFIHLQRMQIKYNYSLNLLLFSEPKLR